MERRTRKDKEKSMREKLRNFMQGRNGYDALSRFLVWVSLALLLLSLFTGRVLGGRLSSALWVLAILTVAFSYFRMFSKNIYKRQAENAWYQRLMARVKTFFRSLGQCWRDRKDYKYFRCPACKAQLRVPRHKGKIRITCKKCGRQFEATT